MPLRKNAFPAIPGVNLPHEANEAWRLDFGPNWRQGLLTVQPPKAGQPFPVLAPQVDADGNERDGVRLPEITVPLATYASWNLRDPSIGAPDQRVAFEGSYLPFPKNAAEREKTGDPPKSIAERYANPGDYSARYQVAVDELIKQRFILPEDRAAVLKRGEQEWAEATKWCPSPGVLLWHVLGMPSSSRGLAHHGGRPVYSLSALAISRNRTEAAHITHDFEYPTQISDAHSGSRAATSLGFESSPGHLPVVNRPSGERVAVFTTVLAIY